MVNSLMPASQDTQSRSYAAVVPFDTTLTLEVTSSAGRLVNAAGQPIQAVMNLMAPKGSALTPVNITMHRN